jgi:hypothetical protein
MKNKCLFSRKIGLWHLSVMGISPSRGNGLRKEMALSLYNYEERNAKKAKKK